MLNLELELIGILILTAVIGLLMGRFLCKSGESEEREEKKKVIHAFKTSQQELELSRKQVEEQSLALKKREGTMAEYEQEIKNFEIKLNSSDTEREKLLEELKHLEKYKPRFEALDREFHLQSKIVEGLNGEKREQQKELSDFKILTNGLDKNVEHLKEKQKELESTIEKLNKTLVQERITHTQVVKEKVKQQKHSLLSKESDYEALLEENTLNFKAMKEQQNQEYEKLQQQYKELMKLKNEAYEELEEKKNKAYDTLKKEKESIEDEYEEFKINYHLDTNRLDTLESDHEKLYQTLEGIVLERDDLLARLRAISSVVGAVGVDRVENPPALLEN